MNKKIAGLILCCAIALGAIQAHAATARIVDSTQMDLRAINGVTAKPVGGIPVGTVIAWPVANNPEDGDKWLECNGQAISQSVYPELFALVGGSVPDFRGLFLRGNGSHSHSQNNGTTVGVTSTQHSSGALGTIQGDSSRKIYGSTASGTFLNSTGGFVGSSYQTSGWHNSSGQDWSYANGTNWDSSRVVPTAEENRPVNKAVRYLIRAMP